MAFHAQPVYAPDSEHRVRQARALVRAAYGTGETKDGTTSDGYTAADVQRDEHLRATTRRQDEDGGQHAEDEGKGGGPHELALEPGAAIGRVDTADAMEETREWLIDAKLTKAIPVFEEFEVDLDSIRDLEDDEIEPWVSALPLDIMQKKRLRKAIANLRAEMDKGSAAAEDMGDSKVDAVAESEAVIPPTVVILAESEFSGFSFDLRTVKGKADPGKYIVSADLKTATKDVFGPFHIVLSPAMSVGIHSVRFCVEKRSGIIALAVTDQCDKNLVSRCCFYDNGEVWNRDRNVAQSQAFGRSGGWQKGDRITLIVDLDSGKVNIESPYGKFSCEWQPRATPVWFAFETVKSTTSLSIEP